MAKDRQISICADDFGMAPAVDEAILKLAQARRLTGTSCLVDGDSFVQNAPALRQSTLQKGLHLNFTEFASQAGVYAMPLKQVIIRSLLHRLDSQKVKDSVARQLDRFEEVMGQGPDYIDGHQHVHQLPMIREALLAEMERRYAASMPWLRYTGAQRLATGFAFKDRFKAQIIAGLGSRDLLRLARAKGATLNSSFTGVYDFQGGKERYSALVKAWLAVMQHGDSMMCHPSLSSVQDDPVGLQRQAEYEVLAGDEMQQWLDQYSLRIA